jgi:formylglycine-generating enzyme required for sulfatase activity/serine/threonine protein kinase/FKBP-type peptidyl-prolyl cis-trans isomerase
LNDQSRSAGPHDPRVDAALREYLERLDRGEPVDRDEFLARHSPIADQLRSFIAAEDEVRKLAGAKTPLDPAHDSTKSFVRHGQETIAPQSVAKREAGSGGLTGQFGRYRIIRVLGKGAMGTVYLAEDTQLERSVAIKTPHFTESPTEESLERFYREARVAATLRQPNICPVHDVGQIDGKHYISMSYIEGRPLSAFIKPEKPQTERQILIVIRKLALALQAAHDKGIVHRDLKPANIMVDTASEPIIMDFGLARQTRREGDIRLTQTGNILGTPAYMSPEQVEGDPDNIGPATDQYSLGVILYEMLTAQLPFQGTVIAVMGQIITNEPPRPSQLRSEMDPRIEAVCLKMMAKLPSERFASTKAVADELATILKSPAAKAATKERASPSPAASSSGRLPGAGASQVLKSLKLKALTESDLASLEELAKKCLARRDYEQVIQVVERIPEERRSTGLQTVLEKARGKADEIAFLICDIDEAERLNDGPTAIKKAEALLKVKPGHHRALEVQGKYSGYGEGGAARIGVLDQFRRPLNDGGWIPWSVLAFGLAVFGAMTAVVVIYLGRTAIVIDIKDPGVEVAVKGTTLTVTGPDQHSVKVIPGDQELTITSAGLETITKSFSLKKGDKQTVTVSIVDSKLVARLDHEIAPSTSAHEEKASSPTVSGKAPSSPLAPAHEEQTTTTPPPTFKNSLGMEFVLVPKGKSWLGGGGGKPGDREVVIAHDFYLGKYEVTQEEWWKANGTTPSYFSRTGDGKDVVKDIADAELERFPVEQVSWDDAQVFLERLNKQEQDAGWVYRLPKEAEWEYACRGGPPSDKLESAYDYYFEKPTNQLLPEQANFDKRLKRTGNVGSYQPNRLGLYDMHGNVWEWCDDAKKSVDGVSRRVAHGGGWQSTAATCRAARRDVDPPSRRDNNLGLRVARVPVGERGASHFADAAKQADTTTAKSNAPQLLVAPFDEAAAKKGQETWAAHLHSPVEITNKIEMKMTLIPAGRFAMGSAETAEQLMKVFPYAKKEWLTGERPVHRVTISQPFYLGNYEVTKGQFRKFMEDTGYKTDAEKDGKGDWGYTGDKDKPFEQRPSFTWRDWGVDQGDDNAPVVNVSYNDAVAFCKWLSTKEGKRYRLPTEAEWEYACRAGTTGRYYNGEDPESLTKIANVWDAAAKEKLPQFDHYLSSSDGWAFTSPVGQFAANDFGLYDMLGNAREWCSDWYDEDYYTKSPEKDPQGPSVGSFRVARGGGWVNYAVYCRCASRLTAEPANRIYAFGFRVALSLADAQGTGTESVLRARSINGQKSLRTPFLVRGEWRIENDELVQPTLVAGDDFCPVLIFGEETLSNYNLTLEAKQTGGVGQLGVTFHILGPGHYRAFYLVWNREIGFSYHYNGIRGQEAGNQKGLNYSSNRWYSLKIETRGDTFRAYLDDVLQLEQTDARFTHGRICLYTSGAAARFRRIKVSDPQGKVLFEGLPELPPASTQTTAPREDATTAAPSIAETNRTKEQRFLTANKTKEGIKTRSSGLQYLILEDGKGKRPGVNDSVTIHYKGTLLNGQIFDDGAARPAPPKSLSLKQVIPGWREALQLMKEGSTWRVFIPSDLAYGSRGTPNGAIGPNQMLIFEIELLKVEHPRRR